MPVCIVGACGLDAVGDVWRGGGIQIGLLNYNPQGFLPWFPIINFPCGGDW